MSVETAQPHATAAKGVADPLTELRIPGIIVKRRIVDDDISMYRVVIHPEGARELLERGVRQRPIDKKKVFKLKSDMENGRWFVSTDCGRITRDGQMTNLQHRCTAGIQADYAFEVWLQVVDPEYDVASSFSVDRGKVRSIAHSMRMQGHSHYSSLPALASLVCSYDAGWLPGTTQRPSDGELDEFVNSVPIEGLYEAIRRGNRAHRATQLTVGALALVLYIAARVESDDEAERFTKSLISGEGLYEGDPVLALRKYGEKLARMPRKHSTILQSCNIAEVWNRWVDGDTLYKCNWNLRRGFPIIIGSNE